MREGDDIASLLNYCCRFYLTPQPVVPCVKKQTCTRLAISSNRLALATRGASPRSRLDKRNEHWTLDMTSTYATLSRSNIFNAFHLNKVDLRSSPSPHPHPPLAPRHVHTYVCLNMHHSQNRKPTRNDTTSFSSKLLRKYKTYVRT